MPTLIKTVEKRASVDAPFSSYLLRTPISAEEMHVSSPSALNLPIEFEITIVVER
jgi:hypothetical protein